MKTYQNPNKLGFQRKCLRVIFLMFFYEVNCKGNLLFFLNKNLAKAFRSTKSGSSSCLLSGWVSESFVLKSNNAFIKVRGEYTEKYK